MKKTVIYFMRHGEVYNPENILYGRLPKFSLSSKGRRQIFQKAKKLGREDIKHIYTSPMLRTRQTAKILGEVMGITPKISKLINEVKLIFEGMSYKEFKEKFQPNLYSKRYLRLGQESIEAIGERMLRFTKRIKKRHPGDRVLAVSHGDPIMILKAKLQNTPFTFRYKKENYLKKGEWFTLSVNQDKFNWE